MGGFNINWLAILVATAAAFVLGGLWYGPLFGKAWLKGKGLTEQDIKESNVAKSYGVTFVLGLVLAFAFSVLINYVEAWKGDALTLMDGLKGGFFVWLGFLFTVKVSDAMFSNDKMSSVMIDSTYRLVWMLIAGAILAVWR